MRFDTVFLIALTGAGAALADLVPAQPPNNNFGGTQSGIGSWFRANNAQDHTNGKSWCGFAYYDTDPVFAPSLKAMGGATWNSNPTQWEQDTAAWCGLEAEVTDPTTGNSMKMYIGDAFDETYVRTPGSIDIMVDAFSTLHGNPNGNKDDVIQGVQWKLTGNRNTYYAAQ
ncbi:hypothetical protein OE88DRAFT_1648099 [Heliocybe sulcata]|uniref:Barwin-like endoglucanase n=1 Tax=Heliocybe sulcata TaxID=5364 RepID=A0A5C3MP91_9AGAM|nr:hypothetical protein OE88DRAFT_1648099 [Heliocybe sulcata]